MNTTLADALHADSFASGLGDMSAQPLPSLLEAWPEQAIDACAPEGGYSPYVCTPDTRTIGLWS